VNYFEKPIPPKMLLEIFFEVFAEKLRHIIHFLRHIIQKTRFTRMADIPGVVKFKCFCLRTTYSAVLIITLIIAACEYF